MIKSPQKAGVLHPHIKLHMKDHMLFTTNPNVTPAVLFLFSWNPLVTVGKSLFLCLCTVTVEYKGFIITIQYKEVAQE